MATTNSNPIKTKKHQTWGFLLIIAGLLILVGLAYWIVGGGGTMSEQKKMESYLEKKYGKEFVVEKPERKASGLGVKGYLQADAYPENESSIRFAVTDSYGRIDDSYAEVIWQSQVEQKIGGDIEDIYGSKSKYELKIVSPYDLVVVKDNRVISYDEARTIYADISNKISILLEIKDTKLNLEKNYTKIVNQLYDTSVILNDQSGTSGYITYDLQDGNRITIDRKSLASIRSKEDVMDYINKGAL